MPTAAILFYEAKRRAKKQGLAFDLSVSDITIPEKCPVFGVDLLARPKTSWDHTPSIDRIKPTLGYVRGNVWVISLRANMMKRDATPEELELLAAAVRSKSPK